MAIDASDWDRYIKGLNGRKAWFIPSDAHEYVDLDIHTMLQIFPLFQHQYAITIQEINGFSS
jgi:hypothetical protein